MKILCVTYRGWAKNIYIKLEKNKKKNQKFYFHYDKKNLNKKIKKINPEFILFYGWSWVIKKNLFAKYNCLMLHPSLLPKFRGGSPIQNQIIRNIKKSAVTIFKINEVIDGGNILYQSKLSLKGTLNDIFKRMTDIGFRGTHKILNSKKIKQKKQNHFKATYYKRRKPEESEITIKELKESSPVYIYNKLRMLSDPYPNPFIKIKNKKLIIKSFKIN
jgi:methionyl-tRNA formyltransferase